MAPTPKSSVSRQRQPSSLSQVHTPPPAKARRASKPSRVVILKLDSSLLAQLTSTSTTPEPRDTKQPAIPASSAAGTPSADAKPDSEASVQGNGDSKSDDSKVPTDSAEVKTGAKRKLEAGENGDEVANKPQRKRPRVYVTAHTGQSKYTDKAFSGENGRMDGRTAAAKALGYNPAAHKLGPKSNMGVINEKLRALDRTRKPCRKWGKTGFQIKSFTGRSWQVPSWKTPQQRMFGEDAESQEDSSNDLSKANSSSQIGSDQSPGGENLGPSSSPVRSSNVAIKA